MRALTKTNDWASLLHVQDRPDCGGWEKILHDNRRETWTQDHGNLLPKGSSKGFRDVAPGKNGKGQQGGGALGYSYGSGASSRFVRSSGVLSSRPPPAPTRRPLHETESEDDDSESETDNYTGYKPRTPSKEEERRRRHQKRDEVVVEKNITTREAKEKTEKARPSCGRRDHADDCRDREHERRARERKAEKKERRQSRRAEGERREDERSEKKKRDPERREKKRRDEQQDQTDGRRREARGR